MSSNPNISTILATDNTGVGNNATITNSLLSVKLQASKFQQNSNKNHGNFPPLPNKSGISTAPPTIIHRSLGKRLENSPNRNVNATLNTGSDRLNQIEPPSLETGDKYTLKHSLHYGNKMATTIKINDNRNDDDDDENIDCSTSDDEEDDDEEDDDVDTENSAESSNDRTNTSSINNNERPKPGRLDLRQFDNITSAIAKLNVQPQLKSQSHKQTPFTPMTTASKTLNSSNSAKNQVKILDATKYHGATFNDSLPSSAATSATRRPLQNPRKNHGRPVAPPRLPSGLVMSTPTASSSSASPAAAAVGSSMSILKTATKSACMDSRLDNGDPLLGGSKFTVASSYKRHQAKGTSSEDSFIDFSQSPIAQRLLRNTKDHKVCELNSPCESENDMPITPVRAPPRVYPRAQDLFKACELPSSFITIGSYQRTHSAEPRELINTRGETMRQLNEILAKPPGRPGVGAKLGRASSTDNQHLENQIHGTDSSSQVKKSEKESKKDKKRDEKLEKRKLKEEERVRRQEEEKLRRQEKKLASKKSKSSSNYSGENSVGDDGIPLFIKRCIEFIESEGLDAEGIYRVPGNRAHVDTFVQKFKENPQMSILQSDIPVNAVATALKDFLSKKLGPLIPQNLMDELTELSSISNKEHRANAVRNLVRRLPPSNYNILKYVFSHFVKVSLNNTLNSMDSKNLAICWWPTLLPLQFNDMVMFEQMRPHLEQSVQTMIDQYEFIFACDDNAMQPLKGCPDFSNNSKSLINTSSSHYHSRYRQH